MMPVILITILLIPMIFMMVCCALLHAKRQMTLLSGGW